MPVASKSTRFDRVRQLLEKAADGEASAFGGLALLVSALRPVDYS